MLNAKDICKAYGPCQILKDVSITIQPGKRTALVGANGVGKSTLLKVLAMTEDYDSGEIETSSGLLVAYLPQELNLDQKASIELYLRRIVGIDQLEISLRDLASRLSEPEAAEDYSNAEEFYTRLRGYEFNHRMKAVLSGLGLGNISTDRLLESLSGGQRSKVALAGVLLRGVDILLLDEPTNNLDLPALVWLEEYIKQTKAGVLMVSHDRTFVDRVVDRVCEIHWKDRTLSCMKGGYTSFLEEKRRRFAIQVTAYNIQQEEIKRLEGSSREKKTWAAMGSRQMTTDNDKFARGAKRDWSSGLASKAKAIEQQLERIDRLERPVERPPLKINLQAEDLSTSCAITLRDAAFSYGDNFALGPINLDIPYGARIGVVGFNGSGKSTMLSIVSGELEPKQGQVLVGTGVIFGHLTQYHQNLPRNVEVIDFLRANTNQTEEFLYNTLAHFHFEAFEAHKLVGLLSPGGRARLLLALFSLMRVNVLLLDEPTNHLDVEAIEAIEDVLKTYQGTVVVISHDRWFMERCRLECLYQMQSGQLSRLGSLHEYEKATAKEAKRMLKML